MINDLRELKHKIDSNPIVCTWQWCIDWMVPTITKLPPNSVVVELGTFVGGTTRKIALANPAVTIHTIDLNQFGTDHLIMIHDFKDQYNLQQVECNDLYTIQDLHLRDLPNVIRHTGDSKSIDVKNIDVAYVDASHTYKDVIADLECIYANLKIGGHIYGDDVDDLQVYYAVYDFAKKYNLEIAIYSKFFKLTKIADSAKINGVASRPSFECTASRPIDYLT